MTTRLEAIPEVYKRQKHLSGLPVDVAANTYENIDNLLRGIVSPNSQVNIDTRKGVLDATGAAIGDTIKSLREGRFLRAIGDVLIGVPGGAIKDTKDALLAKKRDDSVIVRHAPDYSQAA